MTFLSRVVPITLLVAILAPLAGCKEELASAFKPPCDRCGVVESIATREVKGDATGAGAVIGGVIGGVIGHQFGSGSGNDAATLGGAAGGAVAGHEIEKNVRKRVVYDVTVRMEKDGTRRTLTFSQPPPLREGEKVQVTGNQIERVERA